MEIYKKCKNVGRKFIQKGFRETANYYVNRKKEEKRVLQVIQDYHLPKSEVLDFQREIAWKKSPLISIITPLYNTPAKFLVELIESVQAQTYGNWELCLADGSDSQHSAVKEICDSYAQKDPRIIYKKLEQNQGIVGNTNQCIEFASGEYLGLLDHDDILHPSALYEVVKEIESGADFIFTDEMKFRNSIEESIDIVCKNDYGKDELRSHNYICHFVVFKSSLLKGMNRFYRLECEGSQDYDMVLRLTEKAEKIVHIPKILYYWRVHQGSVSMNLSGKQYAVDAAKYAIADQLKRSGEAGEVICNLPYETIYKINYYIKQAPVVSVILGRTEKEQHIDDYLALFLSKTTYRPIEIVCEEGDKRVLCRQGVTFSESATGEYMLFMTEDCLPMSEGWLEELMMYAQRKDVGGVSPWILYRNKTTCFAGAVLDGQESSGVHLINYRLPESEQGYEANMKHVRNTTVLTQRCMLVSRKVYDELGGFDSKMKTYRDADFCLKSRKAGYWNVWTCFAKVECMKNAKKDELWKECDEFKSKWASELAKNDQYYHPLLKELRWM